MAGKKADSEPTKEDLKDVEDQAKDDNPRFAASELTSSELDATRLYLKEIEFSPLLTAEEEVYYGRLALKGDEAAIKFLLEDNSKLSSQMPGSR